MGPGNREGSRLGTEELNYSNAEVKLDKEAVHLVVHAILLSPSAQLL